MRDTSTAEGGASALANGDAFDAIQYKPIHIPSHVKHINSMNHGGGEQKGYEDIASPTSEGTFSTAPNENVFSAGTNARNDNTPQHEESGTFEMGYITFFPKNNETFQSIPEPAQPELDQLKPVKVNTTTNAWTAEQPNSQQRILNSAESKQDKPANSYGGPQKSKNHPAPQTQLTS